MWRSVRQTPQAETEIRTWPAPGSGAGSSAGRRGSRCRSRTIALIGSDLQGSTDLQAGGVEADFGRPLDPGRVAQEPDFDLGGGAAGRDQADPVARVDQLAVEGEAVEARRLRSRP